MPAAAKIEKPTSGELTNGKGKVAAQASNGTNNHVNNSTSMLQEPQKIANSIIEKKVRNLEKRKARLLELKGLEDKGQQLEPEQKIAVKKLENVVEMIDMLKEIGKNVTDGLNDYAKQIKKQQKKEQIEKQAERQQQELDRAKFWLNSQLILSKYLRLDSVKNDLLEGNIGDVKLVENQADALEKLIEVVSPSNLDAVEPAVEKVNNLIEGNKREFISGVAYSDLKELLVKLADSKYFENVSNLTESTPDSSAEIPKPEVEEADVIACEPVQNDAEVKSEEQVEATQAVQNVHHLNNQLCFMRDPVVENELQHKDPAVVAVASLGFSYPPQNGQALSTSSGSSIHSSHANYPPHIYPTVSIPTQTFTNPSYTTLLPHGGYIPVIPTSHPHHMTIPEQPIPVDSRNVGLDTTPVIQNEKSAESPNEKSEQFSSEASNIPSQDVDNKPIDNNGFKRNPRGGRGYSRGNFGNHSGAYQGRGGSRGGGGNKGNFGGYYNNNNNGNAQNPNFNPNNRPVNRQNGGGNNNNPNRPYRQERGVRNQNHFNDQAAAVSAK